MSMIHTILSRRNHVQISRRSEDARTAFENLVPGATIYLDAHRFLKQREITEVWQFNWRLVAAPFGSEVSLSHTNLIRSSFVPDLPGRYLIQLETTTTRGIQEQSAYVLVDEDLQVTKLAPADESTETHDRAWIFQGFTESQWEAMAG